MKKSIILSIILITVILIQSIPASAQVPRHPSYFEGIPLIEGFKITPLDTMTVFYKVVSDVALISAFYNVTDIMISSVTCHVVKEDNNIYIKYNIIMDIRNRYTGSQAIITAPVQPLAPLNSTPKIISSENLTLMKRQYTDMTLYNFSKLLLNASIRLSSIILTGNNSAGNASNATSPLESINLNNRVPIITSIFNELQLQSLASYIQNTINYLNINITIPFYITEIMKSSPQNTTFIRLDIPCQPINPLDSSVPINLPKIYENLSLTSLMLGALLATPYNLSITDDYSLQVARIPMINGKALLIASNLNRIIENLEYTPNTTNSTIPPDINITIENIRNTILNGTEDEAKTALNTALELQKQGLLTQEQLEQLKQLFKERFGYDPFEQQQEQTPNTQERQQQGTQRVLLDLDTLLESLQSIGNPVEPQAPQEGGNIQTINVTLPGQKEAMRAALLTALVALGTLIYSNRRELVFITRSILAFPPSNLTPTETAEWCYAATLRLLELRGLPKHSWETPYEYLQRVGPLLGELRPLLERITEIYITAVYRLEEPPRSETIRVCKQLVSKLRNPLNRFSYISHV